MEKTYSLFQLNEYLQRVIALNMRESVWVSCEIAEVGVSRGHYYLDIIEKNEEEPGLKAKSQAVIWQSTYNKLLKKIGVQLQGLLQSGIKVRIEVKVDYHVRFGLKLTISDIDPSYTMGQLEMKRQETMAELNRLKLLHKNREQRLPVVLQRIAVISSERAAGLQDFLKHLEGNAFGFRFECELFAAAMQGERVEQEVLAQLDLIEFRRMEFDALVIIRGGGARLDLAAFDSLELSKRVALFPLPVMTGIGHETDDTILDHVVHTAHKTPTSVADFILESCIRYESHLYDYIHRIKNLANQQLHSNVNKLNRLEDQLAAKSSQKLQGAKMMLQFINSQLPKLVKQQISTSKSILESLDKNIKLLSPEFALDRGFSITLKDGHPVTSITELSTGDQITTKYKDGQTESTIESINNE